jgi:hypothetical protein
MKTMSCIKRLSFSQYLTGFLSALILLLITIPAQASYWAKTYGGLGGINGTEKLTSIQQTKDGGFIAAGNTYDIWVLKLDSDGNIQWQKTYDGNGEYDQASSIQQTLDGGYIVAGWTSFGGGNCDAWILKLDSDGNIQWQKTYDGGLNFWDEVLSIKQTTDGGFIAAGWTWASPAEGYYKAWVFKLDSDGNIQWSKTYHAGFAGGEDHAFSIQQTSDSGYIVACDASPGAWILKLDPEGNIQWQKIYGYGSNVGWILSIQQTTDGGFIAGGYIGIPVLSTAPWVLKLDSDGNIQWQRMFVGGEGDLAESIQQTSDGGYIVAGMTATGGLWAYDALIFKLDLNGNIQWQKKYGGIGYNIAYSIQQIIGGGYIVAGYTNAFGAGNEDAWVLKLDSNGNINNCSIIGVPSTNVQNTSATVINTNITGTNNDVYSQTSTAFVTNANATETEICFYAPLFPDISISPTSYDFGSIYVKSSSVPEQFSISNTGTADLVISSITITPNPSEFSQTNNCSTVSPDNDCTIIVTFSPISAGPKSAIISISSNDPDTPNLSYQLIWYRVYASYYLLNYT